VALTDYSLATMIEQDRYPSINQLRELVDAMRSVAAAHPYPPLTAIIETLEQAVESFDMEAVGRVLPRLLALAE